MSAGAFALLFLVSSALGAAPGGPDSKLGIPHEEYKLANGLRVVLSRDNTVPVFAAALLYEVGTRTEGKGEAGYANLIERMMEDAAAAAGAGEFAKLAQANGGRVNGGAHPGHSIFTTLLPSSQLAPALWLEANRMHNLAITPETLQAGQDAIRRERLDVAVGYSQAVLEIWPALIFARPQNTHSLLGMAHDPKRPGAELDDAGKASVEDVTKFYKAWFTPNNAVLALAGDFQNPDVKRLIEQYFGPIPSQPLPQRPDVTEQPRLQGKTQGMQDSHVGVPAIIMGWPAPDRHTPQWYALQMLDAILTTGLTGRLTSNLVQGRQSLLQFQSGLGFPLDNAAGAPDPAEYALMAYYRPGLRAELIVNEIQQEIDSIASRGAEADLARIKAAFRVRRITQLQSSVERATLLGEYELLDGKVASVDDDFAALMAVTSADLQAIARKLLTAARRDLLVIQPAPRPAPKPEAKPAL